MLEAILIEEIILNDSLADEFARYSNEYQHSHPNLIRIQDYVRWSFVQSRITDGKKILDVGVGVGQFINSLARSQRCIVVKGIDIKKHGQYLESEVGDAEVIYSNAISLPFEDNSFDYVTCLEVIEHLEVDDMHKVISEVRRVAKEKAIFTVPYCEKMPLPSYHKQRYTMSRLNEIFSDSEIKLFAEDRIIHWAYIEENISTIESSVKI